MTGYELKNNARKLMRDNAPKLFFISLLYVVLGTVMAELQIRLPVRADAYDVYLDDLLSGNLPGFGTIQSYFRPSGIPFAIALWLLAAVLDTGMKNYCLKIVRGKTADTKDLFDGFLFFGKILLLRIVTVVLIVLWSLLLVFPGIAAAYRYRQAYYILLDDPRKGAMQCILESKRLMHKRKLELFLVDLSFIGWLLLDSMIVIMAPVSFPLPIVSILLTPYHGLTCAAYYDRLIIELSV